jgi:excisionase family DNA binding protein
MPKNAPAPAPPPQLLNGVAGAAVRLGVCAQTVYDLIAAGRLRAVQIGKRKLIPEYELQRFVDRLEDAAR